MEEIINNVADQVIQRDEALRSMQHVSELAFYFMIAGGCVLIVLTAWFSIAMIKQQRKEQAHRQKVEVKQKELEEKVDRALALLTEKNR